MEITKSSLVSRAVRGSIGLFRTINTTLEFSDVEQGTGNPIVSTLERLAGFLTGKALDLVKWGIKRLSFTAVFSWIVNKVQQLAIFDWNMTDLELKAQQKANNMMTVTRWGAAVGAGLGWLTGVGVGYGLGLTMPVIGGGLLAKTLAGQVTAEGLEEMRYYMVSAITGTMGSATNNAVLSGYMSFRRFLKNADRGLLNSILGEKTATWVKDVWGEEGSPTYTIADSIEESIEGIPNDFVRNFTQAALEEYVESFIESGYIIAMGLDDAYAQHKLQKLSPTPTAPRAIKVYPDVHEKKEYFYISGTEENVREQAEELITQSRVIGNREIGDWVGQTFDDYTRAMPHKRKATIIFKSIEGKAWYTPYREKAKQCTFNIPDLKPSISWQTLKTVCKPFNWGPHRATAFLDNGRQTAIYGASKHEAIDKLKELMQLSTASIVRLSTTDEEERPVHMRKYATRMYPFKMKLLVRKYDPDGSSYFDADGKPYTSTKDFVYLYHDTEPDDFADLLL